MKSQMLAHQECHYTTFGQIIILFIRGMQAQPQPRSSKTGGRREPGNILEKSCGLPAHHHSCDQHWTLPI